VALAVDSLLPFTQVKNFLFWVRELSCLFWAEWVCPGLGQDRVNFHRNPGRGTAGRADPSWPNRAGYSMPCAVMLGSSGGGVGRQELTRGSGARCGGPVRESGSVVQSVLFCIFPLSVSWLFLFPLFAVLLNCPYPDPPVFASFCSPPHRDGGRGGRVALLLPAAAKP